MHLRVYCRLNHDNLMITTIRISCKKYGNMLEIEHVHIMKQLHLLFIRIRNIFAMAKRYREQLQQTVYEFITKAN